MFSIPPIAEQMKLHGVREVVHDERARHRTGVGVVDVVPVGNTVRGDVKDVLDRHPVIDQILRHVGQPLDLLRRLVAAPCDEALHFTDGVG